MILIIGAGNMGKTYIDSLFSNYAIKNELLFILEKDPNKIEKLEKEGFINVYDKMGNYIEQMDTIILSIKPQSSGAMMALLKQYVLPHQLVISIMAGVQIKTIQKALGIPKVVRAMPNLPAQIGLSITGFSVSEEIEKTEIFKIQNLLNTTGKSLFFEDEEKLNAVTAVSGSGPAYVYYFMNAMREAALDLAFSPSQADMMVEQTFLGAIHLFGTKQLTSAQWIDKVASKGGTTEAGIKHFESCDVENSIKEGIQKAFERAKELGT